MAAAGDEGNRQAPGRPTMTMLAVSIRQPWAWAVIHAGKDVENRAEGASKRMRRGIGQRVLIHASKTMFVEDYDDIVALMRSRNLGEPPEMDCVSACKIDPLRGVIGVQN